eukprot:3043414-Pyramimonas_sp.AAC.1
MGRCLPHGPRGPLGACLGSKLARRRTQPYAVVNTAIVKIFFGGAPYGVTNRMRGVLNCEIGYTARAKTIGLSMKA